MSVLHQWHLILGVITVAVICTLIPVAARQVMTLPASGARRYWIYALSAFGILALANVVMLVWILEGRDTLVVMAMQVLGLFVVIMFAAACRAGFETMRQLSRLRGRLAEGEANLRHYQRNLESLVERRTTALRSEVMRRREVQDQLSRYIGEMEDDLRLARDLQQALLSQPPESEFLHAAVFLQPHSEVSGDTYGFDQERDLLRIFLADAMGHGVAAALLTNIVHAGLHQIPVDAGGPESLDWLNDLLASHETDAFTTGVHLTVDASGELLVTSAGSPEVLILRAADGSVESVRGAGMPLGLLRDLQNPYEATGVQLYPGDRIFAFTDGLYEWRNASGDMFGEERLRELIRVGKAVSFREQGEALIGSVKEYAGAVEPGDDVTLIVAEYTGQGGAA